MFEPIPLAILFPGLENWINNLLPSGSCLGVCSDST
jgi:hypothetical protein